jgi:putative Holliday junction resolvase
MTRYLGIDHGTKRIGLAVGDDASGLASPIGMVEASGTWDRQFERIIAKAHEYGADALVVGLPLNMDDTEGGQAKLVRRFGDGLAKASALPVHYFDERLSSREAEDHLIGTGLSRAKRKSRTDAIAARAILQGFLDQHPPE